MHIPEKHTRLLRRFTKTITLQKQDFWFDQEFNCHWWKCKAASCFPEQWEDILCGGHGVGIYTSVIDQALGEFPRAFIYLLFYNRGVSYNMNQTSAGKRFSYGVNICYYCYTFTLTARFFVVVVGQHQKPARLQIKKKSQSLQHAVLRVKMGIWVMGTGLLVDAVHNVARVFTTNLLMWVCIFSPKTWNISLCSTCDTM